MCEGTQRFTRRDGQCHWNTTRGRTHSLRRVVRGGTKSRRTCELWRKGCGGAAPARISYRLSTSCMSIAERHPLPHRCAAQRHSLSCPAHCLPSATMFSCGPSWCGAHRTVQTRSTSALAHEALARHVLHGHQCMMLAPCVRTPSR